MGQKRTHSPVLLAQGRRGLVWLASYVFVWTETPYGLSPDERADRSLDGFKPCFSFCPIGQREVEERIELAAVVGVAEVAKSSWTTT